MKITKNKAQCELDAFLSKESSLHDLDIEATRVISVCTNTEIIIDDSEVIDMCKTVQDMTDKARQEDRLESSEKARLKLSLMNDVKNIMDSFKVSVDDTMKALKIKKEDQAILMKMF